MMISDDMLMDDDIRLHLPGCPDLGITPNGLSWVPTFDRACGSWPIIHLRKPLSPGIPL